MKKIIASVFAFALLVACEGTSKTAGVDTLKVDTAKVDSLKKDTVKADTVKAKVDTAKTAKTSK